MTPSPSYGPDPGIATSVAIRTDTIYDLPAHIRLLIAWLVLALLAMGISPDVLGLLLALLGLIPFTWSKNTH
jgi:hypothetical protein